MNQRQNRYQKDGFDLDLTYVTPTCIAMALPAMGAEANYRNAIGVFALPFDRRPDDVARSRMPAGWHGVRVRWAVLCCRVRVGA